MKMGGEPNSDHCHCAQIRDHFDLMGPNGKHMVMIFEILGVNLLEIIKKYDYRGIPMKIVKAMSKKILIGLDYLHR
jgi:serine/threonine-protein kinase SRPK3